MQGIALEPWGIALEPLVRTVHHGQALKPGFHLPHHRTLSHSLPFVPVHLRTQPKRDCRSQ